MHTVIIAEAGVNHNGDINIAYKLIDAAKKAGADIVKFQTGKPENIVSRYAKKAEYQLKNTKNDESQLDMIEKLMLPYEAFVDLNSYCKNQKITFLSTPFDLESIDFLNKFDMPFWKIPSGEITDYPYLVEIAKTHRDVVLSTGMSTMDEIQNAVNLLKENGSGTISLLHCNTEYPTPYEDVNLNAMLTLKKKFGLNIGYSDHTTGIEIPIAAVAMGATIIEKHFTLDKNMDGPDHKASLEPNELLEMVKSIRNIEKALGSNTKEVSFSEQKNIAIARKSIVAKIDIKKDEIFTTKNITTKRPGNGISPMRWNEVLGQKAIRDFKEDELIEL